MKRQHAKTWPDAPIGWEPTPAEIAEECLAIQATWSAREKAERCVRKSTRFEVKEVKSLRKRK